MTVHITGQDLTPEDVVRVARDGAAVCFTDVAIEAMRAGRELVDATVARGERVYGVNTGVGMRRDTAVHVERMTTFNDGLIGNHRVGQGPAAPYDVVRGAMLRLANSFAKGLAGVSPGVACRFVDALNAGETLTVRSWGSVGQADLAPMADLAWGLFGARGGLGAKEGLALINNNALSTAWSALAISDCERLVDTLDVAAALDLEAFGANLDLLHPMVAISRPFPGLRRSLERVREVLDGSDLWERGAARNLQDPLTFRNIPAINGALRDSLAFAKRQLLLELNSSQENPIVCLEEQRLISVGNLEILPLASAVDFVRIALAPALTSACERAIKLLQTFWSGLPEGLAQRSGLAEDALAEFGVSIQSLTAEARLLAAPVSFELVSSAQANGIEDRMTLAPLAARRLADMVRLAEGVVAIEMVVAAQAIELRASRRIGRAAELIHGRIRRHVPFVAEGEPTVADLGPLVELIRSGELRAAPDSVPETI